MSAVDKQQVKGGRRLEEEAKDGDWGHGQRAEMAEGACEEVSCTAAQCELTP